MKGEVAQCQSHNDSLVMWCSGTLQSVGHLCAIEYSVK